MLRTPKHRPSDELYQLTRYYKSGPGAERKVMDFQPGHFASRAVNPLPFETVKLRPGMEMILTNQVHPRGLKIEFEIEEAPVSLSYTLSMPVRTTMRRPRGKTDILERRAGESLLSYMPGTRGVTQAPSGHSTGLSIHVARPVFCELFTQLPHYLSSLSSPKPRTAPFLPHSSPIGWETRFAITQILECPYQGDARRVFLEAKALELMAHKLAEMGRIDTEGAAELNPKDLDRTREAYHILLHRLDHPPGLQELSAMVGMNRNKLNRGFKQLYGATVFNTLRDARLTMALSLLKDTEASLSQIALRVGYSDQANFSNAFRRRFGQSPKMVRKNSPFPPSAPSSFLAAQGV